jgi:hypothetical protein
MGEMVLRLVFVWKLLFDWYSTSVDKSCPWGEGRVYSY